MGLPSGIQQIQQLPVKIVGGNHFGRYPKISIEQTFNMIISDETLVDYSGYKNVLTLAEDATGRGAYASSVRDIIIAVVGNTVYKISFVAGDLTSTPVGVLATSTGQVFIAENNAHQIAITDYVNLYIYNYDTEDFYTSNSGGALGFAFPSTGTPYTNPGFVSFQNGRFIIALTNTSTWILSDFNNGLSWPPDAAHTGSLQTKPDFVQAAVPFPGRGNTLFVIGNNVIESWVDVGAAKFPYQKATSFNIDYGVINPSTISPLENFIVWLSANEQSGLAIMVTDGGSIRTISTDGIDFKLGKLKNPENCTGFLFRQDGHLLYQFTFIEDNLSYVYDFTSQTFFTVTDEHLNYHIARDVVFFNNTYYFVSINDGNLYEFSTNFSYLQYAEDHIKQMPRIRITAPIRFPNNKYFVAKQLQFLMENGRPNITQTFLHEGNSVAQTLATESQIILATEGGDQIATEEIITADDVVYIVASERVLLAKSIDGGENFGSYITQDMNPTGKRRGLIEFKRLGMQNDLTYKITFDGFGRFVVGDGILEAYQ